MALHKEVEEEEEEEEMEEDYLTYDRPDHHNKVTLRRSATGLWQVCSSGLSDDAGNARNNHCANRKRHRHTKRQSRKFNSSKIDHLQSESESSSTKEDKEDFSLSSKKQRHSRKILTSVSIPVSPDVLTAIRTSSNSDASDSIGSRTRQKRKTESIDLTSRLNNNSNTLPMGSSVQSMSNNCISPTNYENQTR